MHTPGTTWSLLTDTAAFGLRAGHAGCVHNGKMFISGGTVATVTKNDVWMSTDGITWTLKTAAAGWVARSHHKMLSYDSKLWVIAGSEVGGAGVGLKDVWFSSDEGVNWTQATADGGFGVDGGGRVDLCAEVFLGRMYIFGGWRPNTLGMSNAVYFSTDGITWTLATAAAAWAERYTAGSGVIGSRMYIYGGSFFGGPNYADCYSTSDGVIWVLETGDVRPPSGEGVFSLSR